MTFHALTHSFTHTHTHTNTHTHTHTQPNFTPASKLGTAQSEAISLKPHEDAHVVHSTFKAHNLNQIEVLYASPHTSTHIHT